MLLGASIAIRWALLGTEWAKNKKNVVTYCTGYSRDFRTWIQPLTLVSQIVRRHMSIWLFIKAPRAQNNLWKVKFLGWILPSGKYCYKCCKSTHTSANHVESFLKIRCLTIWGLNKMRKQIIQRSDLTLTKENLRMIMNRMLYVGSKVDYRKLIKDIAIELNKWFE